VKMQRSAIPSSAPKLVIFAVVTTALIGLLATLIGNMTFQPAHTYYAMFSDATGVFKGDRVRLSGVEVGSVKGLKLVDDDGRKVARIEFTVDEGVPVFRAAELQLRYENIVGQRYLSLQESPGDGARMPAGATFPLDQTTPALNLTELFNGFQPLFRALDPERLNTFSFELVRALQGESGSLASLMADTASLTNTIADRDQVIGRVVGNLNLVLTTVGERDTKLTGLIIAFRNLMSGLAKDRDQISNALPTLDALLTGTTGLLKEARPPLRSDLASLKVVAGQLAASKDTLDASLKNIPVKLAMMARTGSYGSWFNFYVCGFDIRLSLLDGTVNLGGTALSSNERDTVCAGGEG